MRLLLLLKLAFFTTLGSLLFVHSDEPSSKFLCDMPSHPDYGALMALYNSTDGDNWNNNTGWDEDCDVCEWFGITCRNDRVWRISLYNNALNGTIPKNITEADLLEQLIIFSNELEGPFPLFLNELPYLVRLQMDNNNFTGTIPSEISSFSVLSSLSISNNAFEGGITREIFDLPEISNLNISSNPLGGTIPDNIGNATKLFRLVMSNNLLSGSLPSSFYNLVNVYQLQLQDNSISGTLSSDLGNLVSLETVTLYGNLLEGPLPSSIGNLKKLESFNAQRNNLEGPLPNEISQLESLISLDLRFNEIDGPLPPNIGDLQTLDNLYLSNNQLSGEFPASFWELSQLKRLELFENKLSGAFPVELTTLESLISFSIRNNYLTGCFPEEYSSLCGKFSLNSYQSNCTFENPAFSQFCAGATCNNSLNLSAPSVQVCEGQLFSIESPSGYAGYQWSVLGEEARVLNTMADESKYYYITITNSRGCTKTDSLYIEVLSNSPGLESASFCPGKNVVVNGVAYDEVGTFSQFIPRPGSCDSIVEVVITAEEGTTGSYQKTICFGTMTTVNSEELSSGNYTQTLTNQAGCDSILTITIEEYPDYSVVESYSACEGSTYNYQGNELDVGTHIIPHTSVTGCDSTFTIIISQGETTYGQIVRSFCQGYFTTVNDEDFTEPGDYERLLINNAGCDSILTISILELQNTEEMIFGEICRGGSITLDERTFTEAGTYPYFSINNAGCDSILSIVITEVEPIPTVLNTVICEDQGYDFADTTFYTNGPHTISLNSSSGCDSLIVLNLTIIDGEDKIINATTCNGTPYAFNGQLYYDETSIQDSVVIDGCRSLVTFNLTVQSATAFRYDQIICEGEDQYFHGKFYSEPGEYEAELKTSAGCDSLVTMNLIVAENKLTQVDTFLCEGGVLVYDGQTYDEAISLIIKRQTVQGCDSIVRLNIDLYERDTTTFEELICEGTSVDFIDGNSYGPGTHSGTYNDGNCIQNFELIVGQLSRLEVNETMELCSGSSEEFMGTTYSAGGLYPLNQDLDECRVIKSLIVIQSSSNEVLNTQVFCEGTVITLDGENITESGVYSASPNSNCENESVSIFFVNGSDTTISRTIEEGQIFRLHDEEYSVAGIYQQVVGEVAGCTSTITLNLFVQKCGGIREESVTLCQGESFNFFGQEVLESKTYTHLKALEIGCDSIIRLNAEVIEEIEFSIEGENYFCKDGNTILTGPDAYVYEWSNGSKEQSVSIENGGVYSLKIYDVNNCVSEAILVVEEVKFPDGSIEVGTNNPSTCVADDGKIQITLDTEDTYLYSIDGGLSWQENSIFTNLANGSYDIVLADSALRCTKELTVPVVLQSSGVPTIEEVVVHQINDCLSALGNIQIIPSDLNEEYIFSIDGGVTWTSESIFEDLVSGTYQVEMKVEGSDCSNNLQGPIDIKNIGNLSTAINLIHEISCEVMSDGSAEVIITEGMPPYEISWSDGQQGELAIDLGIGVYGATVTDANGCVSILEIALDSEPTSKSLEEFVDTTLCANELVVYGLDSTLNYILFLDDLFYAEGSHITVSEPGNYQVIVERSEGCSADKYFKVDEIDLSELGIDFLLATEGIVGVEVVVVNISDPMPTEIDIVANSTSASSRDIDRFTKGMTFSETGTYTISLETDIDGCLASIEKEIIIYSDSSYLGSYEVPDTPLDIDRFIDWKVYPSPNDGKFQVEVRVSSPFMEIDIWVFDMFGRIVAKENLVGSRKYVDNFNLSTSSTGIYTIILKVSDILDAKQIMILR